MGLTAKASSESKFTPVPAGMHLARCYRIIDLGTQSTEWQGQQKKSYKIMILWEVHGEDEQGKALVTDRNEPMSISKNYTMSLGEMSRLMERSTPMSPTLTLCPPRCVRQVFLKASTL